MCSFPNGNSTMKVVPSPSLDEKEILPPICFTNSFTNSNPTPLPLSEELTAFVALKYSFKIFFFSESGIPIPVSDIIIRQTLEIMLVLTITFPPLGVYLIALSNKLYITFWNIFISNQAQVGVSGNLNSN